MADKKEKLFSDFSPVSTEQWMEKVTADLKGADFKLKCTGCGHEIMVSRTMVEKNTKNLKKACN